MLFYDVKYNVQIIQVLFLLLIGTYIRSQDLLSVMGNDRHIIVDMTNRVDPNEIYVVEGRLGEVFQLLGTFQRPSSLQEFMARYRNYQTGFPEMGYADWNNESLHAIWEEKSTVEHLIEMEPVKDRLILAAMGFSVLLHRNALQSMDSLRVRVKDRIIETIPLEMPSINQNISKPVLRYLKAEEDFPFASWQCDLDYEILGFKVYRSIEYLNQWEWINADRSLSINADTMIFIMSDTTTSRAGIYHYAIRCIDLAGNEGPLSDLVRLPKFDGVELPSALLQATGNDQDRVIHLSWEINQPHRVTSIDILRKRNGWDEFQRLATVGAEERHYEDPVDDVREVYIYQLELKDIAIERPIKSIPVFSLSTVEEPAFANLALDFESDSTGSKLFIKVSEHLYLQGLYVVRGIDDQSPYEIVSDFIPFTGDSLIVWQDVDDRVVGDQLYGYSIVLVSDGYVQTYISDTVFIYNLKNIQIPEPLITRSRLQNGTGSIYWDFNLFEFTMVDSMRIYRGRGDQIDLDRADTFTVPVEQGYWPLTSADDGHSFAFQAIHWSGKKGPISRAELIREILDNPEPPVGLYLIKNRPYPHIGWPEIRDHRIKSIEIYRSTEEGNPLLLDTIDRKVFAYEDMKAIKGNTYFYWLVPIKNNDQPIDSSDPLIISYE